MTELYPAPCWPTPLALDLAEVVFISAAHEDCWWKGRVLIGLAQSDKRPQDDLMTISRTIVVLDAA